MMFRPVGDDKRGERLVQVVAEDDNGLVLTGDRRSYRWLRPFFFTDRRFHDPLPVIQSDQLGAGRLAPGGYVLAKGLVGCRDFQ